MGWTEIRDEAGNVVGSVHICDRGRRRRSCSTPGCGNPASKLCDYPVKAVGRKTCDAAICTRCAKKVGSDRDYCRAHSQVPAQDLRQASPPAASGAFTGPVGVRTPEDDKRLNAMLANGVPRDAALEMLGIE